MTNEFAIELGRALLVVYGVPPMALATAGSCVEVGSHSEIMKVAGRILQMAPIAGGTFVHLVGACRWATPAALGGSLSVCIIPLLIHGAKKFINNQAALDSVDRLLSVAVKVFNVALSILGFAAAAGMSSPLLAGLFSLFVLGNLANLYDLPRLLHSPQNSCKPLQR